MIEALGAMTEADEIEADFALDPGSRTVRGSALLRFASPGGLKTFDLCAELAIEDLRANDPAARLFRLDDRVYVLGEGLQEIQVEFQGTIRMERNNLQEKMIVLDVAGQRGSGQVTTFFSRTLPFIPASNRRFARTRIHARLPSGLKYLASGQKLEMKSNEQGIELVSESAGSKGVALSCGNFHLAEKVAAAVPVNLYISRDLDIDRDAYRQRLRSIVDFFVSRFGLPDAPELNLLVQKEGFNGGCSFGGYLINFLQAGNGSTSVPQVDELPPMFLHDSRWDSLVHEVAHQWWGGQISWQKTDDAWISEGLAQYSMLLYWRECLPEKAFARILERMCAGVVLEAGAGKVTEAVKLALVKKDPVAFQVIVYNKAALVFWMLQDLLGEKKMLAALKSVLQKKRFQCLGSEAFVAGLAGNDLTLKEFFSGWVGRADVPEVDYRVYHHRGRVWLEIEQGAGPFVFPLHVCCRTKTASRDLVLPVRKARETFFVVANNAQLRSIEIKAGLLPLRIVGGGGR